MKLVSVIIPIYNVESYLAECLDSVLAQSCSRIEVICINDGSVDSSGKIVQEYATKDRRVIYIEQENQGVAVARNKGLERASGEYVAFMDPDDFYPTTTTLELLYTKAKQANAVICGGSFSDYINGTISTTYPREFYGYTFTQEGFVDYDKWQFDFGWIRFIYHREFLLRHKLFQPLYTKYEDPVFFVQAMLLAKRFYAIPEITYCYRVGHQDRAKWQAKHWGDQTKAMSEILSIATAHKLHTLYDLTLFRASIESQTLLHLVKHGIAPLPPLIDLAKLLDSNPARVNSDYPLSISKPYPTYYESLLYEISAHCAASIVATNLYQCKLGRIFTKILQQYARFKHWKARNSLGGGVHNVERLLCYLIPRVSLSIFFSNLSHLAKLHYLAISWQDLPIQARPLYANKQGL